MFEMEVAYGIRPVADEFLILLMMCLVFCGEKDVKVSSIG